MNPREIALAIGLAVAAAYLLSRSGAVAADETLLPFEPDITDDSTMAENNLLAFLTVIRAVEPDQRDPYRSLVGGGFMDSFADHPGNLGWQGIPLPNGLHATSAGAYQITKTTWNTWIQPRLQLPDFSPASQDAAAIEILRAKRAGAYDAVIKGEFTRALLALRLEWEAFDKMLKGAYHITLDQARQIYVAAGGTLA